MTKRQSLKTTGVNITGDDIRRISSTSIQSMFIQLKTQFNNAFPSTTTLVNSFFLSDFKMKIYYVRLLFQKCVARSMFLIHLKMWN